jgi:hypothetical protein
MSDEDEAPTPAGDIPSTLVESIDQLDEQELRAVVEYAQERYQFVHSALPERIEDESSGDIIQIEERDGYTEVVKWQECPTGCNECPHGPYLYHVSEEQLPNGETELHWSFLGTVDE